VPYGVIRRATGRKCRFYSSIEPLVRGKKGLEIGGPSHLFCSNRLIPVYDRCESLDQCNFSDKTIWDQAAQNTSSAVPVGRHSVAEATDLSGLRDEAYDFVLASHVLEHVANPLRALLEWKRVLRPGGLLLVIVPDKRGTFDHRRPYTEFGHIQADFDENKTEDDGSHLSEILALHDIRLDPGAGSAEHFRERCFNNSKVRAMHHHVFRPEVLVQMLSQTQMRVLGVAIERPFHLIGVAQRLNCEDEKRAESHNLSLLDEKAEWRKRDPLARRKDNGVA
jgi:hypothetical protein